jgi:prephenate dehydrogenase
MNMQLKTVCIIGVGLIGGSLALALKRAGVVSRVVGYGRNTSSLQQALELGVVDEFSTDLAVAVREADVVVLAVPVGHMESIIAELAGHISANTVITDVGSSKQSIIHAAEQHLGNNITHFVPGHPIAGTEKSGVTAAFAELYQAHKVILTPGNNTSADAIALVESMWQQAGASVVRMEPHHHDEVLAATSHLPHLLAFALVDSLARLHEKSDIFEFAAGGFRDFTRIASSNPEMWHDICMANRDAVLKMLHLFQNDLSRLTLAIEQRDSQTVKDIFNRAKTARDKLCNKFLESDE